MTCRPCLDTYIHTYKQTINQYKQRVIIHKSIETYSYTYTWLQMVRPPQPTHRGGAGTLCVHVVSLCADTKTMTCRPCWDTHILTYQQTDRQTHRHTYINQYKHIVIPIHGCICVTYPPFGGGGWGGTRGGWIIYIYIYIYLYLYIPIWTTLSHLFIPCLELPPPFFRTSNRSTPLPCRILRFWVVPLRIHWRTSGANQTSVKLCGNFRHFQWWLDPKRIHGIGRFTIKNQAKCR